MTVIVSEAIIALVDAALNTPHGIYVDFDTEGQAIHFVQRYNRVRQNVIRNSPDHEWKTLACRRVGTRVLIEPVDQHIARLAWKEIGSNADVKLPSPDSPKLTPLGMDPANDEG